MACGTFTVSKVPTSKVQQTIDLFSVNKPPPMRTTSASEGNELHKVTAVFPPCPDTTTQP